MKSNQHFIITGGPSTGKSSVIARLKNRGFECHEEIARQVIKENQEKGSSVLPWLDMLAFSDEVFNRMITLNETLPTNEICFLDRSMVDLIGYMNFADKVAPSRYAKGAKASSYANTVFYMPFWNGIYSNDDQRLESTEEAQKIDQGLRKAYLDLGYQLIEVPMLPVKERVDFIINYIQKL